MPSKTLGLMPVLPSDLELLSKIESPAFPHREIAVRKRLELYSRDWFIEKFEAIHEDFWCVDRLNGDFGEMCALGHAGLRGYSGPISTEALAFVSLMLDPSGVNDGLDARYQQATPKQRIIAALRDLP